MSFVFPLTYYLAAEMRLASARHSATEDATDDDVPSTSGRQSLEVITADISFSHVLKVRQKRNSWFSCSRA